MSKDFWGVKLTHKARDAVHARNRKRSDGELEEIWRFGGSGFEVLGQNVRAWCWVHGSMFDVRSSVDEGLCVDLFTCADGNCSGQGSNGAHPRDPGGVYVFFTDDFTVTFTIRPPGWGSYVTNRMVNITVKSSLKL